MNNLLRACADLYQWFPWSNIPSEEPIEIRNLITGEHRVIQIHGSRLTDVGIALWKSVDDFRAYVCPGVTQEQAMIDGGVVTIFFETEDHPISNEIKELWKHLGIQKLFKIKRQHAYASYEKRQIYPNLKVHGSDAPAPENDLLFLSVAMILLKDFILKQMSRKSFSKWNPIEKKYVVELGGERVVFLLRYPAEEQTIPRGAWRVEKLPHYVGQYTADNLEDAYNEFVSKFEQEQEELTPEILADPKQMFQQGREYLFAMRGICETLWQLGRCEETIPVVEKLILLSNDFEVEWAKSMLVRFYIELGMLSKIPSILASMSTEEPEMLWIAAYFNFKQFGASSTKTSKTLDEAIKSFEDSLLLILSQRSINEKEFHQHAHNLTVRMMIPGRGFTGHASTSRRFCQFFARYWRADVAAMQWLLDHGIKKLLDIQQAKFSNQLPKEYPKPRLTVCSFCTKLKDDMPKCSKCHVARYCDAVCQKAHWKKHKKTCLPPNVDDRNEFIGRILKGEA